MWSARSCRRRQVESADELVVAMDDSAFFDMLRTQIEKGGGAAFVPPASSPAKASGEKKAVKSFFKNLLNSDKKKAES